MNRGNLISPLLAILLGSPLAVWAETPESFLVQIFQGDQPPQAKSRSGASTRRHAILQEIRVLQDRWANLDTWRWRQPRDWAIRIGPLGGIAMVPLGFGSRHQGLGIRVHRLNEQGIEVRLATWGGTAASTPILVRPDHWTLVAGQGRQPTSGDRVRRSTRGREEVHIWLKVAPTSP